MSIESRARIKDVVTVGGGTGSPVVNEALLHTKKVDEIDAIAAVYDSGGATGRRRLDNKGEIAYSDPMRIYLSLVPGEARESKSFQRLKSMLTHRDERDNVLGQDIFNRFSDTKGGFSEIDNIMDDFGIPRKGRVFPSSTESSHITFTTSLGREFTGEHMLDDQRMSTDMVDTMRLTPDVDAYGPAADALVRAKVVLLSSGSLHGSVLANFLPNGMEDALRESEAKMFLVTNLVSNRNETHNFTPRDFVNIISHYTGKRPDGLIVPEMTRREFESRFPRAAKLYESEHSHFLGWEHNSLERFEKEEGIQIFPHNATSVVEKGNDRIVRHDPRKLAKTLENVLI